MSLHFKNGVDFRELKPQALLALIVANECYAEQTEDCLVTCGDRHKPGAPPGGSEDFAANGYHALGQAVDLAARRLDGTPIPAAVMQKIYDDINLRIGRLGGGQYDVVNEMAPGSSPGWTGAHIHIEFDPK